MSKSQLDAFPMRKNEKTGGIPACSKLASSIASKKKKKKRLRDFWYIHFVK
jgi:hypothetical protein